MLFVLKVLGLIFLIFLALIGALVLYVVGKIVVKLLMLRFALKKMAESVVRGGAPAVIHLRPMAAPCWCDEAAIDRLAEPLPDLGFTRAGTFEVEEIDGLSLQAWVLPDRAITAVIYEHPKGGIWIDYFTHFEDGTRITFANRAPEHEIEHAPGHTVERRPGAGARDLFEKFVAARPDKPAKVITAETFPAVFEQTYNDEMAWRNGRPTDPDAYARNPAAALMGLMTGQFDGAQTEQIRKAMGRRAYATVLDQLSDRFRNAGGDAVKAREPLLFVWDRMSPEMLESAAAPWLSAAEIAALNETLTDYGDDDEEMPSPRREFATLNERRPEGTRFNLVGTVSLFEEGEEEADEDDIADVYEAPPR